MALLKRLFIVLILFVAVLTVVSFFLPRRVHVERSTVIDAPRATVFAQINGYKNFNKWSPWYERDPAAKYTYEGPDSGVGAKMSWEGNPDAVGSGSQEIVESRPYDGLKVALDFGGKGKATSGFALTPEGTGTKVTWGMDMDLGMNPMNRYFGLMTDKMVGPDYEKGLANLKAYAERLPKADFADLNAEVTTVSPVTVAYTAASSSQDPKKISEAIGAALARVQKFMAAERLQQAGPVITIENKWADGAYEFEAAIPVNGKPAKGAPAASTVKIKQTYAGKAIKVVHHGAYSGMHATYEKLHAYAAAHGLEPDGSPWDEYVSDAGKTPEAQLVTNIYLPIK